jgi:hypothetical protein
MARLDDALTYINEAESQGGFGSVFVSGLGGLVLAFFSILIGIGEALAAFVTGNVDALRDSTIALTFGFLRAPGRALQSVWNTAATAVGLEPWNTLGPFIVMVFAAAVLGTIGMFSWFLDRRDSDFLGSGTNVPVIGNDADDNEEE